ncbi:putative carbohydrate binding domain containing protein [uncultured Mediterranean phage uvMED]|nr:putative carbohydrate binding domain containing protein [uncultured Mediterranean phage uvMED]BAR37829.1 putative carbohydrate binding domain containing protein [uncultured Mediterranean phage uvMED]BAR37962.1 putative carbohydrate binding domain containing protein [uncultured Mediterranean phage uvMED]
MATVNLGRIKPVFRGAYSGSTAYVVDDIVTHGNESFICIQAHGAGTQATSQGSYWTKLAAKGTDGTDVGTVLTTQGDILYRDGSGLQRLPKGTAGQVLKMNSSANAPEYGTVSSDWVKLAGANVTSNISSLDINGYYTSDYDIYKIFIYDLINDGGSAQIRWRSMASGNAITSGDYRFASGGHYTASNGSVSATDPGTWNGTYFYTGWDWSDHPSRPFTMEITVYDPLKTSVEKNFMWHWGGNSNNDSYALNVTGAGFINSNDGAHSGMSFFPQSGAFAQCKWRIYGLKN